MTVDERIENARRLYERAVFGGDDAALAQEPGVQDAAAGQGQIRVHAVQALASLRQRGVVPLEDGALVQPPGVLDSLIHGHNRLTCRARPATLPAAQAPGLILGIGMVAEAEGVARLRGNWAGKPGRQRPGEGGPGRRPLLA